MLFVSEQIMRQTGFSDNVGGYVIVGTGGQNNEQGVVQGQLWALSLDRGQEGKQLWTTSFHTAICVVSRK